jgi:predicted nucleic acid-binding protein
VSRKWVVNASPLITLGKVSGLWLFEKMCSDLVIPEGVVWEIDQGSADDPARIWIHREGTHFVRRLEDIHPVVIAWDLGKGETDVLSWAYFNREYEAVLDDRAARNCASSLGLRYRGTLGVMLLAKKEGVLPQIKPLVNKLVDSGFRINEEVLRSVYKLANEV